MAYINSVRNKLFLLVSLALCLSGCVSSHSKSTLIKTSSEFNSTRNYEYTEISEYRIVWSEIFDIELNEYFVYLFQRTCSHCQSLKNEVIETALERKDIFFVEDSSDVVFSEDVSNTIGLKSVDELSILGFPTLLKIEDGTLIKNVAGVKEIRSLLFM